MTRTRCVSWRYFISNFLGVRIFSTRKRLENSHLKSFHFGIFFFFLFVRNNKSRVFLGPNTIRWHFRTFKVDSSLHASLPSYQYNHCEMALKERLRKTLPRAILIKYILWKKKKYRWYRGALFWRGDRFLTTGSAVSRGEEKSVYFPPGNPSKRPGYAKQ